MSLPPSEQQISEHLSSCLRARTRKLGELWAVTATSPARPLPDPVDDLAPQLRLFLERNDLERGRRFAEDTLPPRPRHEWTVADLTPPHEINYEARDSDDAPHSLAPAPAGIPKALANLSVFHDAAPPADSDQDGYGAAIPTPRSTVEQELTPSRDSPHAALAKPTEPRLPPDKASTPHSPPLSPHPPLAAHSPLPPSANDDSARERVAPITEPPRRLEPVEFSGAAGTNGDRPDPAPSKTHHDPNTSSPSSPDGPRSTNTSRADGRSTATSPDQETSGHGSEVRRVSAPDEPSPKPSSQPRDVEMKDAHPQSQAKPATNEPQPNPPTTYVDPAKLQRPAQEKTAVLDTSLGMFSGSRQDLKRKRRRLHKRAYSVVLAKPGPLEKDVELVRSMQRYAGADARVPSFKKDWMHLLFLRNALDQVGGHKADLPSLLGSSNKTLSTTDWQSHLHEKQDCAIIKRIYEWQQVSRWPLRQPRPPAEFPAPASHQDSLLKELKWLQTDFREERKFKVSLCQKLALSCWEWWQADPAERPALQVRPDLKITFLGSADDSPSASSDQTEDVDMSEDAAVDTLMYEDDANAALLQSLDAEQDFPLEFHLGKEIATRLPMFEPWKPSSHAASLAQRGLVSHGSMLGIPNLQSSRDSTEDGEKTAPSPEIPPEDTSCALFQPEWETLRRRQQIPFAFKPPNGQMPPSSFYEHRRASQWTEEEDKQLKAWAKDFPSNWNLISERHNQKSTYVSAINRRTAWECYERLVTIMEGATADPTTRQYAKQFQAQLERIRARWQATVQQQAQHAQNNNQQFVMPRFPAPVRVERKPGSKRFLALVDAARKLARKRETAETTRRQTHHDSASHAQKPPSSNKGESQFTPEALSLLKYKRQMEQHEKQQRYQRQQQQAALLAAQQRGNYGGQGNQSLFPNGAAQRTGSAGQSGQSGAAQVNGHLAVPGANQQRPFSQQQAQQFGLPNGTQSNQLQQMMMNGQNQMAAQAQAQQRAGQAFNGSQPTNDQNIQQLMRQQQQQQQQQSRNNNNAAYQAQRQMSNQTPFNRASPNMTKGVPNMNMFNQNLANGENHQSPRTDQGAFAGSNHASPTSSQAMLAQYNASSSANAPTHPQTLSSGRVPTVALVQHQIAQQHPGISQEDLERLTSNELKNMVESQRASSQALDRSRQNAINAATGLHGNVQQAQQQQQRAGNAQSPYMQPQVGAQQQQQQQGQYMQGGMLASSAGQGRSGSPAGQQPNYAQQMRQATTQQMQRNGVGGGRGPASASPAMGRSQMAPPPAMGMSPTGEQQQQQQQRPGSAQMATPRLASQSPRPLSSQGQPT